MAYAQRGVPRLSPMMFAMLPQHVRETWASVRNEIRAGRPIPSSLFRALPSELQGRLLPSGEYNGGDVVYRALPKRRKKAKKKTAAKRKSYTRRSTVVIAGGYGGGYRPYRPRRFYGRRYYW